MPAGPNSLTETDRIELGDRVRDFILDEEIAIALPVPVGSSRGRRMTRAEWLGFFVRALPSVRQAGQDIDTPIAA